MLFIPPRVISATNTVMTIPTIVGEILKVKSTALVASFHAPVKFVGADIKLRLNKKQINIYSLTDYLISAVEEQKILITEKEREVFEEFANEIL